MSPAGSRTTEISARPTPEWLLWAGTAAVAAPVTIILHELGHFAAAHAFGSPDVELHYGFVVGANVLILVAAWASQSDRRTGDLQSGDTRRLRIEINKRLPW